MEVSIAVELEHVRETSRGHLEDCVFDSAELVLYFGIILGGVVQGAQNFERSFLLALQHEPV